MSSDSPPVIAESWLIFLIGAVQCINILDFMMVMPLGPDFARALDIPTHDIGWIGGSYTLAAAISGLIGALVLDNFNRKRVLLVCMFGLILSTLSGALSWNFESLMASRFLAGAFGGPLSTVGLAIIADFTPPVRRGAVMGKVMGSFAVAAVLGVPFGLELARHFTWQAPFIAVSLMGIAVFFMAMRKLPAASPNTQKLPISLRWERMQRTLKQSVTLLTFLMMMLSMMSIFMLIPNISAYVQFNLGYPREQLWLLYFMGGLVSFATMRISGRCFDLYGGTRVSLGFTLLLCLTFYFGFIHYYPGLPVMAIFVMFMMASSSRNVCLQSLATKVPLPEDRASFLSLQMTLSHIATSAGAFTAAQMMTESPTHELQGIHNVASLSLAMSLCLPPLIWRIETALKQRPVA